jgi:anti-sigma B factor antagonist
MLSNDIHQLTISSDSTPEGFHVIRLKGWITVKNEKEFEEVIEQARGMNTILDLTDVPYMDSSGLGGLLKGYVASQKYGGKFVLAGVVLRIRDLLKLTRVESLFQIYANLDEAVSALTKSAGK